jgi:hypothetical protein
MVLKMPIEEILMLVFLSAAFFLFAGSLAYAYRRQSRLKAREAKPDLKPTSEVSNFPHDLL